MKRAPTTTSATPTAIFSSVDMGEIRSYEDIVAQDRRALTWITFAFSSVRSTHRLKLSTYTYNTLQRVVGVYA